MSDTLTAKSWISAFGETGIDVAGTLEPAGGQPIGPVRFVRGARVRQELAGTTMRLAGDTRSGADAPTAATDRALSPALMPLLAPDVIEMDPPEPGEVLRRLVP